MADNNRLYYNSVTPFLLKVLKKLMTSREFAPFRLVGGTGLSLYLGHRMSIDLDLFTDDEYGSINYQFIDSFLRSAYPYVDTINYPEIGNGKSYYVGKNEDECVKLDILYTEKFIDNGVFTDRIRIASIEEIIAMKLEVVSGGGRKKDFWDIHELMNFYSLEQMFEFHSKRYPFGHDRELLRKNFTEFSKADEDFDPICLRGKHWEIIKLDIIDFVKELE